MRAFIGAFDLHLRAQRPSEQRYRHVLDAQSELVCRYLPDTTLTFVNPAYCAWFQQPADELLGRRFIDLVPEAQRAKVLDHVQAVIAHGAAKMIRQVLKADGSTAHQEWIDHAIFDSKGRLTELQGVGRDASRVVRVERELEVLRAHVTHLARVGLLGQLSGAFAHELRQPLTAVLSNAQAAQRLIGQQPVDLAQLADILADIVADDVRMGEVIARLGSLVKKRDLEMQPIGVESIVLTALDLARAKLAENRVSIQTTLAADLPMVRGDAVQLRQVVLNLLINAMDALSDNDPSARRITLSAVLFGPQMLAVEVSDNGPGIGAEAAVRLFEPFTTTKPHGLGLGLSICRAIIEAHHGAISARNNVPRGTTFVFTLPLADPLRGIEPRR